MKVHLVALFLILITGRTYAADYEMNKSCLQAYDYILSLKFKKAEDLLIIESKTHPDNRIVSYLRNYAGFLEVIISEDNQRYKSFSEENQRLLIHVESGDINSPWHLYSQAQLNLQYAFASLRFGDYTNGAIAMNKAYRLLTKNETLYPEFRPNHLALGLLQVLIGSIPINYQWVTKILSIHGTVEQGIRNMQQALLDHQTDLSYPFLKTESIFLLTFTTFNLAENPDQTTDTEHFWDDPHNQELIKGNPLLIYAKSVFLMHTDRNDKALATLLSAPQSKDYYPFYYLQYLTGLAKLNRMDNDADVWFLRYVNHYKGNSFIKSAYQRLAWISLLKADTNGYINYMKRVQLFGNTYIDGDKQAEKEAQTSHIPNALLIKARLLSDGGYYARADKILKYLDKNQFRNDNEKLEYLYRISRNNHKWGKLNSAKIEYAKTILLGEKQKWYFAANSALQLGIIYENEGNNAKARQYYKKCLSMNYDEYRTGISQKAKAGLERVK